MTRYFTNTVKLYSETIFKHVEENGIISHIWKDFLKLQDALSAENNIINIISAPIYSEKEQKQLIDAVIKDLKLTKEMINILHILSHNKRLLLFPLILEHFHILMNDSLGIQKFEAIIAKPLSKEEQDKITKRLEKLFSSKIEINFTEDRDILAGIIIKTDNRMFDASLKTKLTDFNESVSKKLAHI